MQKTYWWRICLFLVSSFALGWGYLTVYASELGFCEIKSGVEQCFFKYNHYIDPAMFIALALLVVSIFLFFVNDFVFKKWLRFTLIWFTVTFIFVMLAPEYKGGWGPNYVMTKEMTSIWMSSLFVIISPIRLFLDSRRGKKSS